MQGGEPGAREGPAMAQPGSLISETERREARETFFSEARRDGDQVTVAAYRNPEELVFDFAQGWVEGTNVHGEQVRLPLSGITRFDLDFTTQEGDEKAAHYFYLLLQAGPDTLVYMQRALDEEENPIPEPSPREKAQINLGALATLSRIEGRSTFPLSPPEQAFQWSQAKAFQSLGKGGGQGAWVLPLAAAVAAGIILLIWRWTR